MRTYRPGPGRPSKGARRAVVTRLPEQLADQVADEAAARDLSISEYVALCLARAHGDPSPLPPAVRHDIPTLLGA